MFRLFECCALSFFERFVLSLFLKIERFVSDSAEIWICGLYNDYIKQLATAEQYDRFISCLDKAVVYKAHTPKSYYAAIGNALPIKSYCGLTIFVPQESLPKMLEWYKQRVGWYKAVYE